MKKPQPTLKQQVASFELRVIQRALARARPPKPVRAAAALGIDTSTLRRKLAGK